MTTAAAPAARPVAGRTTRPGGAVAAAGALRHDVDRRLEHLVGTTPAAPGDINVGWVAALEAAGCPARHRAGGADGWGFPGWSPALAGATVGRSALATWLHEAASGPRPALEPGPPPAPLDAVRAWIRQAARAPRTSVGEWIADVARAGDRPTLAATAANATRWIAGFVRVNGWPLPSRLALVTDEADDPSAVRWPRRWRSLANPGITVTGAPDAVMGKVLASGHFELLVHRTASPPDAVLHDRAAFEAAAGALSCGIAAGEVVISSGDTGDRARFAVGPALLARGADLVVDVVRQRLAACGPWGFDDATPSAACRQCPELDRCPAGRAWLAGPGRWRSGLPALGAIDE